MGSRNINLNRNIGRRPKNILGSLILSLSLLFFSGVAGAEHKGISFQAVIKAPDGSLPTESGLKVTVQILDPVNNCVLREELHSEMKVSNGYLNILVGSGLAQTPDGRNPVPVLSIKEALDNKTVRTGLNCVDVNNAIVASNQTYTPTNLHSRKMRIRFNIRGDEVIGDFSMRAVGFAVNAEMLNSKSDTDFLNTQVAQGLTQANVESVFQRFTKLDAILNNFNTSGTGLGANISGNAATATTALNISGVLAVANGGTSGTSASAARTGLGIGSVATISPTGTADATTFLRGDGVWVVPPLNGGTINEVNAGTGLSGGGTVGSVTVNLSNVGTAGSYPKVTTDAQGRVTSATSLSATDIPSLNASKISSGAFADALLAGLSIDKLINNTGLYFTYKPVGAACSNNQVLKYDSSVNSGNGGWVCSSDAGVGAEADTTVQAFAKVAPSTGLSLDASDHLQTTFGTTAGTVVAGNDSRLTGAFQANAALGGDLTGTLSASTVAAIYGRAVAAAAAADDQKFLKYIHGAGWQSHYVKLSELKDAAGTGSAFDVGACTAASTLAWSSLTDQFSCQSISVPVAQVSGLATVATSADYTDLTNLPTIPAAQSNANWLSASGVTQILNKPTLGTLAAMSPTGTADNTTFLRGDGAWAAIPLDVETVAGKSGAVTLQAADISDFSSAVDARITAQKGNANGLASLNGSAKIPSTQIDLASSDIPDLAASKITSGTFSDSFLAGLSIDKTLSAASKYLNYKPNAVSCDDDEVLKYDSSLNSGSGGWSCAVDDGLGAETDSTVAAYSKSAPSIGISVNGSDQLEISFGTIAGVAVAGNDARVTGAFSASTSLGGDLDGTLPNPSVVQLSGQAVSTTASASGQALRYNGTSWNPNFLSMFDLRSTVNGTQAFGGVGCTAGQTLAWTAATDNLSCVNIAIAHTQVSGLAASATTDTTNATNIGSGTLAAARFPTSMTTAWVGASGDLYFDSGSVGIGNTAPKAKLHVTGEVKFGQTTMACNATTEGAQRYNSLTKAMEFCNGTSWQYFGSGPGGVAGLRSCDRGTTNDVMVAVGSWCVDKYEASVWSASDGTGTQYFADSSTAAGNYFYADSSNRPASFNRDGSGTSPVYAVSKPDVFPARGITWYQAAVACMNSGKVLIPDSVWQMASLGTVDPATSGSGGRNGGSAADAANARCNTNTHGANDSDGDGYWLDNNNKLRKTNRAGATNQGSNACISRFGVHDMIGNLAEWTDLSGMQAGPRITGFTQGMEGATGGAFSADRTVNINGQVSVRDSTTVLNPDVWKDHSPAVALRGGAWFLDAAGLSAHDLFAGGSESNFMFGFRCAMPR